MRTQGKFFVRTQKKNVGNIEGRMIICSISVGQNLYFEMKESMVIDYVVTSRCVKNTIHNQE